MWPFKKKREVLAVITREESDRLAELCGKRDVAKKLFEETDTYEFELSYDLWVKTRKECGDYWCELEEKYGIPPGMGLHVDHVTREITMQLS